MPAHPDYNIKDLVHRSKKIEKLLPSFGLDVYPQEFEIIDSMAMLQAQIYFGIPSYYPHWSFGKNYEIKSTLYSHGLTNLPYELVINSNPCLAYLMAENNLAMQILTMAHVYGHNNFFKNNGHFKRLTNANESLDFFRSSAEKIRRYSANPTIGQKAVQKCITAAHGIQYQCKDIMTQDLLSFLVDNSPRQIENWEKVVVKIVVKTFDYFRPQMMTQVMNEGWASYHHYKIVEALKLPADLRFAIGQYHASVVRIPDDPSTFNPYFIGFKMWEDIEKKYPMREIMEEECDQGFVNKYLTPELMEELGLYLRGTEGDKVVVQKTPEDGFSDIKEAFVKSLGLGKIPVLRIKDSDHEGQKGLYLHHVFDGRNLEREHTAKTLEHISYFWPKKIILETKTYRRYLPYIYQLDEGKHLSYRVR